MKVTVRGIGDEPVAVLPEEMAAFLKARRRHVECQKGRYRFTASPVRRAAMAS